MRGRKSDSEIVRGANGKADSKDYPLGFFFSVS